MWDIFGEAFGDIKGGLFRFFGSGSYAFFVQFLNLSLVRDVEAQVGNDDVLFERTRFILDAAFESDTRNLCLNFGIVFVYSLADACDLFRSYIGLGGALFMMLFKDFFYFFFAGWRLKLYLSRH